MNTALPGPVTLATDAEKLDVYRVALAAHAQATTILTGDHRILRDQLERASLSVILNAAVDVIAIRGLAAAADVASLPSLFVRSIQMLTKLDDALA